MLTYTTKDGDVLDGICYVYYGHLDGVVERVLEANPHLSYEPPVFEAGVKIVLPDLSARKTSQSVKLWS